MEAPWVPEHQVGRKIDEFFESEDNIGPMKEKDRSERSGVRTNRFGSSQADSVFGIYVQEVGCGYLAREYAMRFASRKRSLGYTLRSRMW
jgi:hypothetical protein